MTDATGLNSLLRQIGGSVGLAVFATLLTRYATQAQWGIAARLPMNDPKVMARIMMMQRGFMAKGIEAGKARQMALEALNGNVLRQSMVLSFDKIFLLAGVIFLLVIPLLFFLKTKKEGGPAEKVDVHIEL